MVRLAYNVASLARTHGLLVATAYSVTLQHGSILASGRDIGATLHITNHRAIMLREQMLELGLWREERGIIWPVHQAQGAA